MGGSAAGWENLGMLRDFIDKILVRLLKHVLYTFINKVYAIRIRRMVH